MTNGEYPGGLVVYKPVSLLSFSGPQSPVSNGGFPQYLVTCVALSDGASLTGFTAPGDLTGSQASPLDPKLGPLADNGGPTLTMALLPGSPAIDAGDTSLAPPTDQRGFPRPFGPTADIGAYELSYSAILRISGSQETGLDIVVSGKPGQACRLLASSGFSNWIPIATNQIGTNGTLLFHEAWASSGTGQFYRVVMP